MRSLEAQMSATNSLLIPSPGPTLPPPAAFFDNDYGPPPPPPPPPPDDDDGDDEYIAVAGDTANGGGGHHIISGIGGGGSVVTGSAVNVPRRNTGQSSGFVAARQAATESMLGTVYDNMAELNVAGLVPTRDGAKAMDRDSNGVGVLFVHDAHAGGLVAAATNVEPLFTEIELPERRPSIQRNRYEERVKRREDMRERLMRGEDVGSNYDDGNGGVNDDDVDWMAEMLAQEAEEDRRQEEERLAFLAAKAQGYTGGSGGGDGGGVVGEDNRATWLIDQERAEAEEELRQEEERQAFLAEKKAAGRTGGVVVDNRESWMIDQERQEAEEERRQEDERRTFLAEKAANAKVKAKSALAGLLAGAAGEGGGLAGAARSGSDVAAVEIGDGISDGDSDDPADSRHTDEADRAVSVDVRASWLIDQERQEAEEEERQEEERNAWIQQQKSKKAAAAAGLDAARLAAATEAAAAIADAKAKNARALSGGSNSARIGIGNAANEDGRPTSSSPSRANIKAAAKTNADEATRRKPATQLPRLSGLYGFDEEDDGNGSSSRVGSMISLKDPRLSGTCTKHDSYTDFHPNA